MGGTSLTIGKGVVFGVDRDSHVLPDGQSVPPRFTTLPVAMSLNRHLVFLRQSVR